MLSLLRPWRVNRWTECGEKEGNFRDMSFALRRLSLQMLLQTHSFFLPHPSPPFCIRACMLILKFVALPFF